MNEVIRPLLASAAGLVLTACQSYPPMETVDKVDIQRFMGDWYVIANIPTALEREAYNAVESYELGEDGTIETTFTFRKGGFDGPRKEYSPRGFVTDDPSNAVWGMQFIWPIKADYRIIWLEPDYSVTVIARKQRDYVWIMARTPRVPDEKLTQLTRFIEGVGYDVSDLQKVPQQWP